MGGKMADLKDLRDKCAIVGIGETKYGKLPGISGMSLRLEASKKAIEDAGMTKDDIDGILTTQSLIDPTFMAASVLADHLKIAPTYLTEINVGGASPVAMVCHAVAAISAGMCANVLCVYGENFLTGFKIPRHGKLNWGGEDFEQPYGLIGAPGAYALAARRHMYEYGTTSEQFGAVAVAMRKHACLNPNATMREPITLEDHQKSRMVTDPFRLLDCCLVSDGGGAVVITSAERARDLKHPPVYIMGMGQCHPHWQIAHAPTMTTTGAKRSGEIAFRMAGITPKDIDFAEIYDCFTFTVIVQLEDYGFCKKGEGGPFVEGGRIELGGELPVNTHGGLLSEVHIEGMNHIIEAVRQLRGTCNERQVKDAKIGLVSGNGGYLSTHATLILRK